VSEIIWEQRILFEAPERICTPAIFDIFTLNCKKIKKRNPENQWLSVA
jgi:hypothetical protein